MAAKKDYLFDPKRNPLLRRDYRRHEYTITDAFVRLQLDEEKTIVHNRIWVKRNPDLPSTGGPLILDGENLKLKSVQIVDEDKTLRHLDPSEYLVTDKHLILKRPPNKPFALEIVTEINPKENTQLSGLYMANDILCTQCEAQGFRRISYFLDRPDNLTKFTVSLVADKEKLPVLLSNGNGNFKAAKDLGDGRHSITWTDPHPKPSYLFAVVAGDMKVLEDTYTTMSGKKVDLRIFVQPGYEDKITWAMESIKRSMKWDEDKYGREYDLDCFHVVAVDKFNAGAMENKGLNIFNVSLLIGSPETSTDHELIAIEGVIGHEYFHNWSGNRVTCRDWFELTLKEGLTVLRDRQFTSDLHSKAIQTIDDANELRAGQFMEDSSPASHPIRPDRVEEFENIYTGTIYTKGSHVLGMLNTILGDATWRAGMDEYFSRFDGQAVTCEDFVATMEEVSGLDLKQFRLWYSQSGTPEISYSGIYDATAKTYTLTLTQNTPATADQPASEKKDLHIPVRVGLIGESGKDVAEKVLHLTGKTQSFVFENISGPVVPSVLRGFSAPVKVTTQPSDDELMFRMAHDADPFNKYEATERLMIKTIHGLIEDKKAGKELKLGKDFLAIYSQNLSTATDGDMAFAARILHLPSLNLITQDMKTVNPFVVDDVLHFMRNTLAKEFKDEFKRIYEETRTPAGQTYDVSPAQVGRRELYNLCLPMICRLKEPDAEQVATAHYKNATNMTEKYQGLSVVKWHDTPEARAALEDFYQTHKENPNLVCKWITLRASIAYGDTFANLKELMRHEAFDKTNPNKVFALFGGLVGSLPRTFHREDGAGYKFLADFVIELNDINPKTGAGLVRRLTQYKRYDDSRQKLMLKELKRIMTTPKLDPVIKELVGQALAQEKPQAARTFDQSAGPKNS